MLMQTILFATLATLNIIIICKTHLSVYTLKRQKKKVFEEYARWICYNQKYLTSCLLPFIVRDHFGFIHSRAVQVQPAGPAHVVLLGWSNEKRVASIIMPRFIV